MLFIEKTREERVQTPWILVFSNTKEKTKRLHIIKCEDMIKENTELLKEADYIVPTTAELKLSEIEKVFNEK